MQQVRHHGRRQRAAAQQQREPQPVGEARPRVGGRVGQQGQGAARRPVHLGQRAQPRGVGGERRLRLPVLCEGVAGRLRCRASGAYRRYHPGGQQGGHPDHRRGQRAALHHERGDRLDQLHRRPEGRDQPADGGRALGVLARAVHGQQVLGGVEGQCHPRPRLGGAGGARPRQGPLGRVEDGDDRLPLGAVAPPEPGQAGQCQREQGAAQQLQRSRPPRAGHGDAGADGRPQQQVHPGHRGERPPDAHPPRHQSRHRQQRRDHHRVAVPERRRPGQQPGRRRAAERRDPQGPRLVRGGAVLPHRPQPAESDDDARHRVPGQQPRHQRHRDGQRSPHGGGARERRAGGAQRAPEPPGHHPAQRARTGSQGCGLAHPRPPVRPAGPFFPTSGQHRPEDVAYKDRCNRCRTRCPRMSAA